MTQIRPPPSAHSSLSSHDMLSLPGSSTPLSIEGSLELVSDPEEHPPSATQSEDHHHHNPSTELLTALTRHLVMPRLPILPNTPSSQSIPSNHLPTSHQLQKSHSSSSASKKISSSPTARLLLVGDAPSAHGLGSLDGRLSSIIPFPNHLDRASEILPQFKLSDPSTYDSLIQHIESPFIRLKEILNPKFFYRQHHSCLPTPTRDDLINVVNAWIEREGYLLLMIEVTSFPLSAEKLEFILALSRLIPTIPFIPSQIPPRKAIDGQAIITRQLVSKRVRHFSIPKPNHYQSFMFPNREECLVRSSKCYLDWLTVEYATSNLNINHDLRDHQDFTTTVGGDSEDDYFEELDRWSEKVSIQMKRRNLKDQPSTERWRRYRRPASSGPIVEQIVKMQRNKENEGEEKEKQRHLETWISIDSLGLPSLTGLIKIGLGQIRKEVKEILRQFYRCILLNHSSNEQCDGASHQPLGRDDHQVCSDSDHYYYYYSHFSHSYPPPPPPPSSSTTTTWFIIGFVTATTAATLSVWYRNKFFFA